MKESFEKKLEQLEGLVEKIQDKEVPLEEAMLAYEEGVNIARELDGKLTSFERKVEILKNEPPADGSGEAELEPFSED